MTTDALRPPRHTDFATTDPEAAHEFLRHTYGEQAVRIRGSQAGFRMRHAEIRSDEVTVATVTHTMSVEHDCEPLGGVLVGRMLTGELERETAGESAHYGPGDVFVVARPEDSFRARWNRIRVQTAWIDRDLLGEVAATEDDRPAAVRFTGLNPVSPLEARHWRVTVDYVMSSLLKRGNLPASPLVVGSAARLLAAATLSTFPNSAAGALAGLPTARRPDTTPGMVRRVIGVMEERAHENVSDLDLAGAARVSPDELRLAFRRHLATTPAAYLRQVRLDRAHEQLLYPDPHEGISLPEVAGRWGFADLPSFVAAYRAAYGREPEETLGPVDASGAIGVTAARRTNRGRSSPSHHA